MPCSLIFCDEFSLMMDVMRVDDHGFQKQGNIINPTLAKEHQLENELRDKGIHNMFPNASLTINANLGLPTEEDHNYRFYRDNFARTVSNHIKKIPNYQNNHPGYKLIFLCSMNRLHTLKNQTSILKMVVPLREGHTCFSRIMHLQVFSPNQISIT